MLKQALLPIGVILPATLFAQSDVAFPPRVHAARRTRLTESIGNAPVIVPGEYLVGGAGKQDLNFWYLTGVESPYAVLVMTPGGDGMREVLFLPEKSSLPGLSIRWRIPASGRRSGIAPGVVSFQGRKPNGPRASMRPIPSMTSRSDCPRSSAVPTVGGRCLYFRKRKPVSADLGQSGQN